MKHDSLQVKKFTIKEDQGFRLRIESWECINPKELFTVNFINESLDNDGTVVYTSTYNFHMSKEEIKTLAQGLLTI